ncbi:MAG: CotH kinase family protein [Myxococcales bacterium]|nr:CotH kinase family protein [Myxococcales bacterium]
MHGRWLMWVVAAWAAGCDSAGTATPTDAAADAALDGAADGAPADAAPVDAVVPDAAVPDATVWPAVVLNEVDCRGRDWIELAGPPGTPLAGWRLSDVAEGGDNIRYFSLPAGSALDAAGFFALRREEGGDPGFDFGVACDETLYLRTPDGRPADTVTLPGDLPAGASFGRLPDVAGPFAPTTPSRGGPNAPWITPADSLFAPGVVAIDLTLSPDSRAALEADPLDPFVEQMRATVPATVTVQTVAGAWGPAEVGLRLKGRLGSLRGLDRKAGFKVDVNHVDGGLDLFGLRALALNNAVQDPSFLHEIGTYRLLDALGLPSLQATHAWVRVDGEPFGLYVVLETWDDAIRRLPGTDLLVEGLYGQDLFRGWVPHLDVDAGDAAHLADLDAIAAVLEEPPPGGAYAALADRVDWDEVLGVMATELFIGHWDGYAWTRNNWFMHLDRDGVLRLLPWGVDQVFLEPLPLHAGQGLLLQRCLESPACTRRYDEALARVVEALDAYDLPADLAETARVIAPYIGQDPRLEFGEGTIRDFQADIPRFFRERRAQVAELLACRLGPDPDPDGDGAICDQDCAPDDPAIAPGRRDVCGDGIDQDCSGFADDAPDCPDCVERPAEGGGTWLICPRGRSFEQAEALCAEQGATLVRIDDARANRALHAAAVAVRPVEYWIGLDDRAREGDFRWADGTRPAFTAWAEGEPNNAGEEDCAHFWPDRPQWNDAPCEAGLGALCVRP